MSDERRITQRREYEGGVLVFDLDCSDCNWVKHRCPGCGDQQRHDGRSVHDGHTASDCLDDIVGDRPPPCEHYGALDFDDDGHERGCLTASDQPLEASDEEQPLEAEAETASRRPCPHFHGQQNEHYERCVTFDGGASWWFIER